MRRHDVPWRADTVIIVSLLLVVSAFGAANAASAVTSGCMSCHKGIEPIRAPDSPMMRKIVAMGTKVGDPAGCVICHGGNPRATTRRAAHAGTFYPDPGSPWINDTTCGTCHRAEVRAQWQSLMMTEAGKIHGTAWGAGLQGYEHLWANYDVSNPSDPHDRLGSKAYRLYKEKLAALEPNVFPDAMKAVPAAPSGAAITRDPRTAAFTYIREECERCHLGVRGRQTRGDFRGMGCSACHIPYSNEGLYEGSDPTIPKDQPGHLLVHSIQATRDVKVTVHGHAYSGVPVETCTTCHDRGKRIGVSFQGLMESAYSSPWSSRGQAQPKLHSKHYISMKGDIHNSKYGMVCQDCHTSEDIHGDGFLAGSTLGSVEIECTDCHGTPRKYPWELPLGYGDEFGRKLGSKPRGVATTLLPFQKKGTVYPPEDGYLLSARGNPLGNVVRKGDEVIVHTAGGRDLKLEPLKMQARLGGMSLNARVAMVSIGRHIDTMECYSCHAQWAPQCYGCHVKIDYSNDARAYDWVAAGHDRLRPGHAAEAGDPAPSTLMIPGHVSEQRSYLRWEDPALGVNGEGRITPLVPGCQVVYTIVGPGGKTIVRNKIYRTPPNTEGGGPKGQLSINMAPIQPHTNGHARSCESCHASAKAAGYGIDGGRDTGAWNAGRIVDIAAPDGTVLAANARTQIEPIPGLVADWSRLVTEQGRQLQTVGDHWKLSRPLNQIERGYLDRRGLCLGCHQEIPKASLAVSVLHHLAAVTGQVPTTPGRHAGLLHKILLTAAWAQVGGMAAATVIALVLLFVFIERRK